MSKRDFTSWLNTFRSSVNTYDYYVDFENAYKNAERYKVEISILGSLIGSKNIEQDFDRLIKEYPTCIRAIPILLAVRQQEIYCQDENLAINYNFDKAINSIAEYQYFMRKTGLFDLLANRIIANLYDYVTGVEVGLSSNGRKNRGGHQMESLVERFIKEANIPYHKEMYLHEIEDLWQVDLSAISNQGKTKKRWDFVVKTASIIYLIETNFYASGGSKLNETARSYKMIATEASQITGVEFMWITDGAGWKSAKGNLQETFDVMTHIYNIRELENGILNILFG